MIKVEAIYIPVKNHDKKFDRISVTIGDKTTDCPIAYIRVSEAKKLEQMLNEAYETGYRQAQEDRDRKTLENLYG
jgi:predicted restriction endonuclease